MKKLSIAILIVGVTIGVGISVLANLDSIQQKGRKLSGGRGR